MILRPFTLLCLVAAAGSGLYLYQTKHHAQLLERNIARTMKAADTVRQRAGLMRAEYALLNDPSRLAELSEQLLPALKTTTPGQFSSLADFERRLPAVGAPPAPEPLEPQAPDAVLPKTAAEPAKAEPPAIEPARPPQIAARPARPPATVVAAAAPVQVAQAPAVPAPVFATPLPPLRPQAVTSAPLAAPQPAYTPAAIPAPRLAAPSIAAPAATAPLPLHAAPRPVPAAPPRPVAAPATYATPAYVAPAPSYAAPAVGSALGMARSMPAMIPTQSSMPAPR